MIIGLFEKTALFLFHKFCGIFSVKTNIKSKMANVIFIDPAL